MGAESRRDDRYRAPLNGGSKEPGACPQEPERPALSESALVIRLRRELRDTREQMQLVITMLEATNQALQAANEEVLTSNEELQRILEELETETEDLQAEVDRLTRANREALQYARQLVETTRTPLAERVVLALESIAARAAPDVASVAAFTAARP
jgi:phage-related minor tail protein